MNVLVHTLMCACVHVCDYMCMYVCVPICVNFEKSTLSRSGSHIPGAPLQAGEGWGGGVDHCRQGEEEITA